MSRHLFLSGGIVFLVLASCHRSQELPPPRTDSTPVSGPVPTVPARDSAPTLNSSDTVTTAALAVMEARLDSGLAIIDSKILKEPGWPFPIIEARYSRPDGSWPVGDALAVLIAPGQIRWIGAFNGDYSPHSIHWLDVNADGRRDLLMLGGDEDVEMTWIYLDDPSGVRGDFVRVLTDSSAYLSVVDLDGDRIPEFLGPAFHVGPDYAEDDACQGAPDPGQSDSALDHAEKVTAPYRGTNFDYGLNPSGVYVDELRLLEPIRILSFRSSVARDVTRRFPAEIRWRKELMEVRKQGATPACVARIDSIVSYFIKELPLR